MRSFIQIFYLATAIVSFNIPQPPSLGLSSHGIFVDLSLALISDMNFQSNKISGSVSFEIFNVSHGSFLGTIINHQKAFWPYLLKPKAGHTLHKPITQVTCLKPYCTITVSSLVQVPPTHYAIFFSQLTGRY